MVEEPPELPPVPSEDAEVPPTAALPPLPPVAAPCANAKDPSETANALASTAALSALMLFLLVAVNGAAAIGVGHDGLPATAAAGRGDARRDAAIARAYSDGIAAARMPGDFAAAGGH